MLLEGGLTTTDDEGAGIPITACHAHLNPFFGSIRRGANSGSAWQCHEIVERHGGPVRLRTSAGDDFSSLLCPMSKARCRRSAS
jgi:hypothetical protein